MKTERPSPEAMLARAAAEGEGDQRGRLTIFFGMAPGVGKTYALLQSAHEKQLEGVDVVLGWIESHGRVETERLTRGLERLPPRVVDYRGLKLTEFDVEAALRRKPDLILLDELAHTNAAGSRHARRWRDADELLRAGIDVYTTLNVQHVESLNDVVAAITGVIVRETVPDSIVDEAHELKLVDITPDELLRRLRDGKVYVAAQAERAMQNFFRVGNLLALRELALRRTAERVDAQGLEWRRAHGVANPWGTRERVLVAVGPAPSSANVIRAAYRLATRLRAPWMAVAVETPGYDRLDAESRQRATSNLALAQLLGAETVVVQGERMSKALLELARERAATKIVVGKPGPTRRPARRDTVADLVRESGEIDVLVTSGEQDPEASQVVKPVRRSARLRGYALAVLNVGISAGVCSVADDLFSVADKAMIFLLGVLFVAARTSRGPSLLAAVLSVAALNFLFVPPRYTFVVGEKSYWLTFAVMLVVGVLVSTLTARLKDRADAARERERLTSALYSMGARLAIETSVAEIAGTAVTHTRDLLGVDAIVLLADRAGRLTPCGGADGEVARSESDLAVARWVFQNGRRAGHGTDTLPGSETIFIPLVGAGGCIGAFGIALGRRPEPPSLSQWRIVETFVTQMALALERALLVEKASVEHLAAERERTRSALLSAVSHDVRTPLASITGAASTLESHMEMSESSRRELLQVIREEAKRLTRLINGILDVTRLESGDLVAKKEPYPLEEIIESAIERLRGELADHPLERIMPDDVLLAAVDPTLLEQVFVNLLENASKYSGPGSPIQVRLRTEADEVVIEVADRGPGLPPGEEDRVFERFYRARDGDRARGTGMGLTICEAIVRVHEGRIDAQNRAGGGAVFRVSLPLCSDPCDPPEESIL